MGIYCIHQIVDDVAGTAFIAMDHLELQEITCLPSGTVELGMVSRHICTVRHVVMTEEGGNLQCGATVYHAINT
jgi:hypothetical protein